MRPVAIERQKNVGLVRCISVIIGEIAAHPPDFTELFILIASEGFKARSISAVDVDKGIVKIVFVVLWIGVEGCTLR